MVLTTRGSRLLTVLSSAFILLSASIVLAGDIQKIPIEQAIKDGREAREMCRQTKIRAWQKSRGLGQALGPLGALPSQYQYDVHFYNVDLDVNITAQLIYGRVDMVATATQDGVTSCQIDLYDNMTVDSVLFNGGGAPFTHSGNLITVSFPGSVDQDQEFTTTVFYQGHPVEGGFQAFSFDTHSGQPVVSSLSEPYLARTWWPCKDYPDDKADSVHVVVTYPSDLFCSSNGVMVSNISNGDGTRTTYWVHRYPIATYLVSIAMTNYTHWQDTFVYGIGETMPVDYWVYPERLSQAQAGWAATVDMLDTLSDRFGLYPFADEKYAMSMFPWGGAMEHQTNTSVGAYATSAAIAVHEMGHQWWGDMITCRDWQNIWLNEGFATYTEAIWYESLGGFNDLRSYMNGMFYSGGGTIYCQDTTDVYSIFSNRVYDKGAWVLHMLRHEVGDATFFDILHTYYDAPGLKWATATTEDFRDICETVSGMNLHDFFQDWIYGTYYPRYVRSFAYDQLASDSFRVYAHVRQEQTTSPQVFHMTKVDLSVYDGSTYHDFSAPMIARDADYVIDVGGMAAAPQSVLVDRNDWILKSSRTETYRVHIIYDTLGAGMQYISYQDSVIVRGGSTPYNFQITSGSLPSGVILNTSTGVISGSPSDTGSFAITVQVSDGGSLTDSKAFSLYIEPTPFLPGDADHDGIVNISDAVYLISYIFGGGAAPDPLAAGDVNADCLVNISDAVSLIAFIFGGGAAPLAGCAK